MKLVSQLLDHQLLDAHREKFGRVDGIVLTLRKDKPPRVLALESGAVTIAHRLHAHIERFVVSLERRLGVKDDGKPLRIPLAQVRKFGVDVVVELDAEEAGAEPWEEWLCDHVLPHIPGSGV
jgi:sporulation protein YlmC with PRC-barrel domain